MKSDLLKDSLRILRPPKPRTSENAKGRHVGRAQGRSLFPIRNLGLQMSCFLQKMKHVGERLCVTDDTLKKKQERYPP